MAGHSLLEIISSGEVTRGTVLARGLHRGLFGLSLLALVCTFFDLSLFCGPAYSQVRKGSLGTSLSGKASSAPSSAQKRKLKSVLVLSLLPKVAEQKVLAGIAFELGRQCRIRKVKINGKGKKLSDILKAELRRSPRPEAIISLGTKPSKYLASRTLPVSVVCLGVNQIMKRDLPASQLSKIRGVDFELCQQTILQKLGKLVPNARKIGELKELREKTSESGLLSTKKLENSRYTLLSYGVKKRRDIARTSLKLLRNVDVLWLRPSRLLNQPDTVRYLLGKALELGRPVIGLSQNYVRAGALFCLQPDFKDIGAQLATVLQQGDEAKTGLKPPRRSILCVNARVAQLLGLRLGSAILNDKDVVVVRK